MKIECWFNCMVVGKAVRENKEKTAKYYSLAVICNGEAGNISVTEECFNNVETMKNYGMVALYDVGYKSMKVIQANLQK